MNGIRGFFNHLYGASSQGPLAAVQAGFRTRRIMTVAITDVRRNVTHLTDPQAICIVFKIISSS